LTILIH